VNGLMVFDAGRVDPAVFGWRLGIHGHWGVTL
jgi:hypothetical protein